MYQVSSPIVHIVPGTTLMFGGYAHPEVVNLLRDESIEHKVAKRAQESAKLNEQAHLAGDADNADNTQSSLEVDANALILLRYFNDIQNLFLKKFLVFSSEEVVHPEDTEKLKLLLDEMIKVKGLISSKYKYIYPQEL